MKDVAIVSFAQWSAREEPTRNEVEMLIPVVAQAIDDSGVGRKEIGFTCSGSCDYLAGAPFAFVMGLDAVGAWPPIRESHVEMDGAWALYEAWVRLQHGDVDTALVYSFGKSSLGDLPIVLSQQMDPYYVAPLWPDSVSIAALQARAWLDTGHDEGEMAAVAARSRRFAQDNQWAQVYGDESVDALLTEPYVVSPLRKHDIPPISDGANGHGARRRRPGARRVRQPGLDPWHRAPHRGARPRRARPRALAVDEARRARRPAWTASTSPSCTRRSATRSRSSPRRSG